MDKIKQILGKLGVKVWKLVEEKVSARELFLVERDIDMNRAKQVTHYILTVYADFDQDGVKYRGSANTKLSPSMTDQEIEDKIKTAYFAAGFVKNKWYPLVKPTDQKGLNPVSALGAEDILPVMKDLYQAVYGARGVANHINATEFFINQYHYRIENSLGLDITFNQYQGQIEVVTHDEDRELAVEVCRIYDFADSRPQELRARVEKQMEETRWRKEAKPIAGLANIPVILSNDAVAEFFAYYYAKAGAREVYSKVSQAKIGQDIQGQAQGDKVTMTLVALLDQSSQSAGYDREGHLLRDTPLYQEGRLLTYHGDNQYAHYLGLEATGTIPNFKVEAGSMTYAQMTAKPHLELLVFSDFQMDEVTGDFGGEVRLARYFDGQTYHSVTGLSLAARIGQVEAKMYFSKEMTQHNNYYGPAHIYLADLTIS